MERWAELGRLKRNCAFRDIFKWKESLKEIKFIKFLKFKNLGMKNSSLNFWCKPFFLLSFLLLFIRNSSPFLWLSFPCWTLQLWVPTTNPEDSKSLNFSFFLRKSKMKSFSSREFGEPRQNMNGTCISLLCFARILQILYVLGMKCVYNSCHSRKKSSVLILWKMYYAFSPQAMWYGRK